MPAGTAIQIVASDATTLPYRQALIDKQAEIDALEARVAELEAELDAFVSGEPVTES
jgi:hypothetical protein